MRLGANTREDIITNTDVHRTKYEGKMLGLNITNKGYAKHVLGRISYAKHNLSKLYRFYNMPLKIKTHLVKTLILPILDYPPIPTHALSKTQIKKLQKTQNKALRYATNQTYPYSLTTQQIHDLTNTLPVNIQLHNRATKIWQTLEQLAEPAYNQLKENMEHIRRYNKLFPSSLSIINTTGIYSPIKLKSN